MGFTPDQISHIGKMKADGQTWDDIAASLGSKADTVRIAYKRACKNLEPNKTEQNPAIPARTRATKREPNKTEQKTDKPNKIEQSEQPRAATAEIVTLRVTRDMTIGQMADLLDMARKGYERAKHQEDESKRTWQETSYMKLMKDILVQMGKWCGLDDTVHENDRGDVCTAEDVRGMSLDEMRELVRKL